MRLRYLIRFTLLAMGFGLSTLGLLAWQQIGFGLDEIWPLSGPMQTHPVHLLAFGLALVPPTLWEIFVLENHVDDD